MHNFSKYVTNLQQSWIYVVFVNSKSLTGFTKFGKPDRNYNSLFNQDSWPGFEMSPGDASK